MTFLKLAEMERWTRSHTWKRDCDFYLLPRKLTGDLSQGLPKRLWRPLKTERSSLASGVRGGNIDLREVPGEPGHHLTVLILNRFHRKIGPLVRIRVVVI